MSPQTRRIMQQAMEQAAVANMDKVITAPERPARPATPMQLLKLQRHMNKPHGHHYLLEGKQA